MLKKWLIASAVALIAVFAAPKDFVADFMFTGSTLAGWHSLGDADWRADKGEIVAKPKSERGGWLVLDRKYQDIQLVADFRCEGACKAGVLLRVEKTADGMKGVYVSLSAGDIAAYSVTLDGQGKEISRSAMPPGPGPMIRMATARFSGGEDLVPGFSKPAPTLEELKPPPPPRSPADGAR